MATTCGVLTRPGYRIAPGLMRTGCFRMFFINFHIQ